MNALRSLRHRAEWYIAEERSAPVEVLWTVLCVPCFFLMQLSAEQPVVDGHPGSVQAFSEALTLPSI